MCDAAGLLYAREAEISVFLGHSSARETMGSRDSMRRVSIFVLLLLVTGRAAAKMAVICVKEVEVRSGPSAEYYPTGKLVEGDKVEIRGEQNGYLAITPPRGSFGLIPKERVERKPGDIHVVNADGVPVLIGSTVSSRHNATQVTLNRGAMVQLLGEVELVAELGRKVVYYQIEPAEEVRYIPASAIREAANRRPVASGPPPLTEPGSAVPPAAGIASATALRQADAAYQKGDWAEAKRLYEPFTKSADYEARMTALNRLEFIRQRMQTSPPVVTHSTPSTSSPVSRPKPAPAPTPKSSPPAKPTPAPPSKTFRATSSYTYVEDSKSARLVPMATQPVAPALPAAPPKEPPRPVETSKPVADSKPVDEPRVATPTLNSEVKAPPPAPVPAERLQSSGPGRLRRAYQPDGGRPLYFLEDGFGRLRYYVSPPEKLELDAYVNQLVELWSEPPIYRGDLRGDHLTAVRVEPLPK